MSIGTLIKTIQDIMRKDVGVDGDAQRISQIVWLLFLKIFDDKEHIMLKHVKKQLGLVVLQDHLSHRLCLLVDLVEHQQPDNKVCFPLESGCGSHCFQFFQFIYFTHRRNEKNSKGNRWRCRFSGNLY